MGEPPDKALRKARSRICGPTGLEGIVKADEAFVKARDALKEQARCVRAMERIRAHVAVVKNQMDRVKSPYVRARMLAELADWLVRPDVQEIIAKGAVVPIGTHIPTKRFVPAWARAHADIYQAKTLESGEFAAAQHVRALIRDGG